MKAVKRTWSIILAVLIVFGMFAVLPKQAEAAGKSITKLNEGIEYSINLNGGSKEKVRWTSSGFGSNYTFGLYVNGKQVYKKSYQYALSSHVYSMDINISDKYKELIVNVTENNGNTVDYFILRYYNETKIKRYSAKGVGRIPPVISNTGKNKFYLQVDTPFYNQNFGQNHVKMAYKLSGNKVERIRQTSYQMLHPYDQEKKYSLKKAMKLYSTASKKNVKGELTAGTSFKTLQIKAGKKHTKTDNYGYKTICYDLYVKVKTSSGKTGWLYFPAFASDYRGDYLTSVPGWG